MSLVQLVQVVENAVNFLWVGRGSSCAFAGVRGYLSAARGAGGARRIAEIEANVNVLAGRPEGVLSRQPASPAEKEMRA